MCGKDGNIWFLATYAQDHYGSSRIYFSSYLGCIDSAGNKKFYNYESIQGSWPTYFTVDSYGNFWIAGSFGLFGNAASNVAFYKITPEGVVTKIYIRDQSREYVLSLRSLPYGSSNGNIWIILENNTLAYITQDGNISSLFMPLNISSDRYWYNMTEDTENRLWIAGNYTISLDQTAPFVNGASAVQIPTDKMVRGLCIACDASGNIVFPGEDYVYANSSKICKIILTS